MRKMKLGGRIAWSYALLFLTLMTIFIIMLNITLKNENKKVLETAAGKKVEEIEKRYLNRIAVYSELYESLLTQEKKHISILWKLKQYRAAEYP